MFDQYTWDGITYSDTVEGAVATGTYNDALAPIAVTNAGALPERWVVQFTSATAFRVIGEHVGVVATTGTIPEIADPIITVATRTN